MAMEIFMKSLNRKNTKRLSLMDTIRSRVAVYLYNAYNEDEGLLGNLDRFTQRRITDENLAKLALVFNSEDPAETCYRDLIREIDAEAETGIYLVSSEAPPRHLRRLMDESGVSGEMHRAIKTIAPIVFSDEFAYSTNNLDRVWVRIQATHDRAHVDATVSEIILSFFLDDADAARDVSNAMRALQYSFHEDVVRRRCDLTPILDDQNNRELLIMVSELAERSGSYQDRIAEICTQADAG
jgi:hypothetical protein